MRVSEFQSALKTGKDMALVISSRRYTVADIVAAIANQAIAPASIPAAVGVAAIAGQNIAPQNVTCSTNGSIRPGTAGSYLTADGSSTTTSALSVLSVATLGVKNGLISTFS